MYIKYPRTFHLPWSETITSDDRVLDSIAHLINVDVICSEKRDGENSTIYSNGYFHARSINGNNHPSQNWLKNYIQSWYYKIPNDWRVCGENLYATHSIKYDNLKSYFNVFSIWDENNNCLSWDDMEYFCKDLNLNVVPVLYKGQFKSEKEIKETIKINKEHQEGYVIRLAKSFNYDEFDKSIAKFVRCNHVQNEQEHWRTNWDSSKINELEK